MDEERGTLQGRSDGATTGRTAPAEPQWVPYEVVADALRRRTAGVGDAVDRLQGPVTDEDELVQVLTGAVDLLVRATPAITDGSITLATDTRAVLGCSTSSGVAAALDGTQAELDDGPCLRALRTSRAVSLRRADLAPVWPGLSRQMVDHGVAEVWSRPLGPASGRGASGVVNLYLREAVPAARRADQEAVVAFVTRLVERALLEYDNQRRARLEVEHLHRAMSSRAVIEQAKGVLMADHGMSADEAFEALVRMSRPANVKVRDLAERVVASAQRRRAGGTEAAGTVVGEQHLVTAFEHGSVGTAITDATGTVLAGNHALGELLGVRVSELTGTSLFSLTCADDLADAHAACERLQRPDALTSHVQVRFVRADGVVVPAVVLAAKVRAPHGGTSHLVMQLQRRTQDERRSSRPRAAR